MSQRLDEKLFQIRQLAEAIVKAIDELESASQITQSFCKGCHEEILWTKRAGQSIPVNPDGSRHDCEEYRLMKQEQS